MSFILKSIRIDSRNGRRAETKGRAVGDRDAFEFKIVRSRAFTRKPKALITVQIALLFIHASLAKIDEWAVGIARPTSAAFLRR
jgi:hypothetical protein